jgi:hypothetical protein
MTDAETRRERAAEARDEADLFTLDQLRAVVGAARVAALQADEVGHPDARWSVRDLIEALGDQITNIDAERARIINRPLVLGEDAT